MRLTVSEELGCLSNVMNETNLTRCKMHMVSSFRVLTFMLVTSCIIASENNINPIISLPTNLNIDESNILIAGYDNSGDFSHQFHIAFSSLVSRSCIFSGQPFRCAVSQFNQDTLVPLTNNSRVPYCDGCPQNTTLEFNHCKISPNVVDVGSLVDYPRRHCGQNPITIHQCFDDVYYMKNSKVFISRNTINDTFGAVENTVALLSQMIDNPQSSIKFVIDDENEIKNCLAHVYDAPWIKADESAVESSWYIFNQSEFFNDKIGFENQGWIYIPQRCQIATGDQVCKLIIRPDKCSPLNNTNKFASDINEFAKYAEINAMIILHPCLGENKVDTSKYPNSYDIQKGKLDVYGQLSNEYVQQSAPHMSTLGNMIRRLLNKTIVNPTCDNDKVSPNERMNLFDANNEAVLDLEPLPTLNIDKRFIMAAGCSNTADFSHQFHVSFSSIVTGSCIFSGMPFHCAVTRFDNDYMVPETPSTSAGMICDGCDINSTLIYDHCKNHPHWVDIDTLTYYAETSENIDDPKLYLKNARVFVFGPTHDRCYQPPAMDNVAQFHLKYATNSSQIKLVTDQPFPHTLPTNTTPYFNDNGNYTGAGYDGPGECLNHVFGYGTRSRLWASPNVNISWWRRVNVSQFISDTGVGMRTGAWLFVPPICENNATRDHISGDNSGSGSNNNNNNNTSCKLLILPGGCDALTDLTPPISGSDNDFAKYGTANNIVILKPCSGGPINQTRFPQNHENLRGLCDVYGQLGANYSTQIGGQMKPIGAIMKKLIGMQM